MKAYAMIMILAILIATSASADTMRNRGLGPDSIPVFDSTTTVEDYVAFAIKNRSGLKAAREQWQETVAMRGSAGALDNPLLSYEYGYTKFSDPVGPERQKFGIMQALPWFGTLGARKKAAGFAADANYERYRSEELSTVYRVKAAYYEYFFAARQLELTKANFELMRQFEEVVRTRYSSGLSMHPDLIKAQVELGEMEEMIRSMEFMLAPTRARLLAQLNLPDSTNLPAPREFEVGQTLILTDSLVSLAEESSPNLGAIRKLIESRRAEATAVNKMTYPELMLGVEYERASLVDNMTGEKETMNEYMLNVQVSLPIWFGKNKAMRDAARARVRMSEYMHQEERNDLAAMIAMTNFEYNDAVRKMRLYRDGLIPKADESLNATFTAYQSGATDFLMLLDAQRQLLEFELTAERSKVNAATKLAELEMITGTKLINTQSNNSQ
ncbi:MAG: TolC family protein [Candidatus Zixiibacteriota bacterium]